VQTSTTDDTFLLIRPVRWNGSTYQTTALGISSSKISGEAHDYLDVDLRYDSESDQLWAVACDASSMHLNVGEFTSLLAKVYSDVDTSVAGDACFTWFGGTLPEVHVSNGSTVVETEYDPDNSFAKNPIATGRFAGYALAQAVSHGDWLVLAYADGGLDLVSETGTEYVGLLSDYVVYHADASWADRDGDGTDEVYISAVVQDLDSDSLDDVVFAYGDPDGTLTVVEDTFEIDGEALEAEFTGIHADADRVFWVVSGSDAVGWQFLQ
jgi:hypothetical protein